MSNLTAYHAVLDTMASEPGRPFSIVNLQYETGYTPRTLRSTLERLAEDGRVRERPTANETYWTFRPPCASSARVPGIEAGRCNGCNEYNLDGSITKIAAGVSNLRMCDQCLTDAGLERT